MKQKTAVNNKKPKKPNISFRRRLTVAYGRFITFLKIACLLFCCLLFFTNHLDFIKNTAVYHIYELTAEAGLQLENILIEGQHNIKSEDILAALNADTGTPILSIDLAEFKHELEKNNWIKAASVERHLPKTIYVTILERTPIAIWQINQKLYLVDDEGFNITNKNIENFSNLPHVVGTDANIYAARLIEDLKDAPEISKKLVSSVRYGERRWNLNLDENITVKMPEKNFKTALKYINELNKAQKLFGQNYKTIDLRDITKYYIEKF